MISLIEIKNNIKALLKHNHITILDGEERLTITDFCDRICVVDIEYLGAVLQGKRYYLNEKGETVQTDLSKALTEVCLRRFMRLHEDLDCEDYDTETETLDDLVLAVIDRLAQKDDKDLRIEVLKKLFDLNRYNDL